MRVRGRAREGQEQESTYIFEFYPFFSRLIILYPFLKQALLVSGDSESPWSLPPSSLKAKNPVHSISYDILFYIIYNNDD